MKNATCGQIIINLMVALYIATIRTVKAGGYFSGSGPKIGYQTQPSRYPPRLYSGG